MGKKAYFFTAIGSLLLGSFFFKHNQFAKAEKLCPFCNDAVLEKQAFYEDDRVIALYNFKPACKGHCLIIPKRHHTRFESLSEEELSRLGLAIQKVHKAASTVFKTSSYLLLQKNGKEVGQSVPHIHIHYIPRKIGDRFQLIFLFKILLAHLLPQLSNYEIKTCKALMEKEIY